MLQSWSMSDSRRALLTGSRLAVPPARSLPRILQHPILDRDETAFGRTWGCRCSPRSWPRWPSCGGRTSLAWDLPSCCSQRRHFLFLPSYQALSKLPKGVFGHGAEFFDVLFAIEWAGLVLFVPAVVSRGADGREGRNTLQLLFLTKLGPWTILLEKLLSRLVPVATFLLVAAPTVYRLFVGRTDAKRRRAGDRGAGAGGLSVASIALFCSAFSADVGFGVHPVVRDHGPHLPVFPSWSSCHFSSSIGGLDWWERVISLWSCWRTHPNIVTPS